jgi:hypothetical protein
LLFLTLEIAGCQSYVPVMMSTKTHLENQILGTFKRLERDLILASSVRGDSPAPKLSPLQREAVEAMMSREFNRDDIDALKQEKILGEANTGLLVILKPPTEVAQVKRVRDLLAQENRDRMVIIKRAIQLGKNLSPKDLPAVRRTFYRLNVQIARPGDKIQLLSGRWEEVQAKEKEGGKK